MLYCCALVYVWLLNCSHCIKGAKDKLEKSKETLEAEKAALDEQVRELNFRLEVRVEDLGKKEVGRQKDHHRICMT